MRAESSLQRSGPDWLSNIELITYQDERLGTDALVEISQATFSGDFGARQYLLATEAEATIVYFDQQGQRYVDRQSVTTGWHDGHRPGEWASLPSRPMHLRAAALELEATGQLTPTEEGLTLALSVSQPVG